jgi:hypothetical protein
MNVFGNYVCSSSLQEIVKRIVRRRRNNVPTLSKDRKVVGERKGCE